MDALQGIRFAAFSAIFLLHCLSTKFCYAAAWAVGFFVILSGYLYGMKYAEQPIDDSAKGILTFTWRRIRKLYPLHIVTSLAVLPLCNVDIIIQTQNWSELWKLGKTTVLSLTLLQSWIPSDYHGLNGVSWFLSSIVFLYFMTPWLVRLGKYIWEHGKMMGIVLSIVLLIAAQYTYSVLASTFSVNYEFWLYIFPPARLAEYCIGILLGIWMGMAGEELRTLPGADLWLTIVFACIAVFCFVMGDWDVALWRTVLWIAPNVMILIFLSGKKGLWGNFFSSKIMVWLGNISFELFLIHQVLARYVTRWSDMWDSSRAWKLTFCGIVFVGTLLFAFLWSYFTRRDEKRKKM